jgi:sirohydrochlorin ferrochelatase
VRTAVIILFHGSRAEGAGETPERIATEVERRGKFGVVTTAFLQHGKPDLMEAVRACVRQDAGKIIIVPFFLQLGMHVTADIPVLMDKVKMQYPDLTIVSTNAVGSHPLMAEIVVELAREIEA